jgi:hypothetical protein
VTDVCDLFISAWRRWRPRRGDEQALASRLLGRLCLDAHDPAHQEVKILRRNLGIIQELFRLWLPSSPGMLPRLTEELFKDQGPMAHILELLGTAHAETGGAKQSADSKGIRAKRQLMAAINLVVLVLDAGVDLVSSDRDAGMSHAFVTRLRSSLKSEWREVAVISSTLAGLLLRTIYKTRPYDPDGPPPDDLAASAKKLVTNVQDDLLSREDKGTKANEKATFLLCVHNVAEAFPVRLEWLDHLIPHFRTHRTNQ